MSIEDALASSFSALVGQFPNITQKLDNMQSLHDCKDSRDDHFQERQNQHKHFSQNVANDIQLQNNQRDFFLGDPNDLGEEILEHIESSEASRSETNSRSYLDAQDCLQYADRSGMFDWQVANNMDIFPHYAHHQEILDTKLEQIWAYEYEQGKLIWKEKLKTFTETFFESEAACLALGPSLQHGVSESHHTRTSDVTMQLVVISENPKETSCTDHLNEIVQRFFFNKEQKRAFTIVAEHSMKDQPEQQELMITSKTNI